MVEAGEVHHGELVLEVGPGQGTLTEKLLETGAKIISVEKDDRLIGFLQEKFEKEIASGQLKIIHGGARRLWVQLDFENPKIDYEFSKLDFEFSKLDYKFSKLVDYEFSKLNLKPSVDGKPAEMPAHPKFGSK